MGSIENMTLDNTGVHKTLDTLDRDENMTPPRIEFTHHTTVALSSGYQFVKLALYIQRSVLLSPCFGFTHNNISFKRAAK